MVEFLVSTQDVVGSSPICCSVINHSSIGRVPQPKAEEDAGSNPAGLSFVCFRGHNSALAECGLKAVVAGSNPVGSIVWFVCVKKRAHS